MFCEGPATFTCTVSLDFNNDVFFRIDGMSKYSCGRGSPDLCQRNGDNPFTGTDFNIANSSFSVSVENITAYNGSLAQCTDSDGNNPSNPIIIHVVKPLTGITYDSTVAKWTVVCATKVYSYTPLL